MKASEIRAWYAEHAGPLCAQYKRGATLDMVAAAHGCSIPRAARVLDKNGVARRSCGSTAGAGIRAAMAKAARDYGKSRPADKNATHPSHSVHGT